MRRLWPVLVTLLLLPAPGSSQTAETKAAIQEIFRYVKLEPSNLEALRAGQIVEGYHSELDVSKSNLIVILLGKVNAPVNKVADELREELATAKKEKLISAAEIHDDQPFPSVNFEASELEEVKRLLRFKGGDRFNLSATETEHVQQIAEDLKGAQADERLARVSAVYGKIVENRYRRYRESGASGIEPYLRQGGKVSSPAEELRLLEKEVEFLERWSPKIYRALVDYPNTSPDLAHTFHVIKKDVDERPAYALVHQMVDEGDDYFFVHLREYFVGHTYSSSYMVIFLFSYEGGTLAALSTDAFTDKVAGIMSGIAKPIGRGRITATAKPLLVRLQERF